MYPNDNGLNIKNIVATEEEFLTPLVDESRVAMLIEEAIKEEITDSTYYMDMAEIEENEFIKELYKNMADDEIRHSVILKQMYSDLTGVKVPNSQIEKRKINEDKISAAQNDILSELNGSAFYRDLITIIEDKDFIDELNLILNDEQNHAILNGLILNLRK